MKIRKKKGIEFWSAFKKEYGGHSHWLASLFGWKILYFYVGFCGFRIGYNSIYYDGNHHGVYLGFIAIEWGT